MKKGTLGSAFLYLYVIASRLGEEAAILEGILLERFETLLSPILGLRLVLGEFLQQGLGRLPGELRSGRVFQQLLQQVMGVLALGQHIAGLPVQVLLHQPGRALHRLEQPVQPRRLDNLSQLPCHLLLPGLVSREGLGLRQHRQLLLLLRRVLHRHHGYGPAGTRPGANAAANTLRHIDDAVLRIRCAHRADIQAQAILGTQAQIPHSQLFHRAFLPSTFSNFQAGTLHTGQNSGGTSPT